MDDDLKKEIRKIALQNAVEHNGKTKDKVVLSKSLGTIPELKNNVKEVIPEIASIVSQVNGMSIEEQKTEIQNNFPEIFDVKENVKEERVGLPPLEGAEQGKVVTRFTPAPNGYPHIGHAKAAIISEEYAKMYGGKLVLRYDDTNPEDTRLEYWAAIKVGLDWLGIEFDEIKNTSDDIGLLYDKCVEMIKKNYAYVCTCKRDTISKNRKEMASCECSMGDVKQNEERWERMFKKYKPGEAVVRFRGDMESKNTVMRDPVLFRINDARHARLAEEHRVWPSYDIAVAVEDSTDGITHALRSKEYELRNELYHAILDALDMRHPKMLEFSRLEFKGMPVSKRILRPLIDEGKVSSYDDPRLPTLAALERRGITPEAIRKFTLSLSLTKADTLAPFDSLEAFNRKIVDENSIRLFMVKDPTTLTIRNLPNSTVELPNHPSNKMGTRKVMVEDSVFLSSDDVKSLKIGDQLRLMGLGNVKITYINSEITGEFTGDERDVNFMKLQWVSQKNAHKLKILIPQRLFVDDKFNEESLEKIDVYVEPHYLELKNGEEIQFVRFGYCRKDSSKQAIFTHK
uniref:Glutamate--tRNA ligase n=1 Tax=uncultured marine crenarchaeote HF4000_ANIW137N18 TaxID=455576 RepID=B3T503_9ARCH|nr:putative tRNA synthetases class I (E and Q), catalytic domain protein [uncultured marine crenarchaeote HF4000_ANIW137N18]